MADCSKCPIIEDCEIVNRFVLSEIGVSIKDFRGCLLKATSIEFQLAVKLIQEEIREYVKTGKPTPGVCALCPKFAGETGKGRENERIK
jgi:hypothetical protein